MAGIKEFLTGKDSGRRTRRGHRGARHPLGRPAWQSRAELLQRLGAEVRIGAKVAEIIATSGGGLRVRLAERGRDAPTPPFLRNENHTAAPLGTGAGQEGGSGDQAVASSGTGTDPEGGSEEQGGRFPPPPARTGTAAWRSTRTV